MPLAFPKFNNPVFIVSEIFDSANYQESYGQLNYQNKRTVVLIHLFDLANCEVIYTPLYQSCLQHYAYHLSYQWDAFSSPSSSTNIWLLCGLYTSLWGSHGGIPSPPSDLLQIICSNAVVLSSGENLPPTLSDY